MKELLIQANSHLQSKNLPYNLLVVSNGIVFIILYKGFSAPADSWEEVATILVSELPPPAMHMDAIADIKKWIDKTLASPQINLSNA